MQREEGYLSVPRRNETEGNDSIQIIKGQVASINQRYVEITFFVACIAQRASVSVFIVVCYRAYDVFCFFHINTIIVQWSLVRHIERHSGVEVTLITNATLCTYSFLFSSITTLKSLTNAVPTSRHPSSHNGDLHTTVSTQRENTLPSQGLRSPGLTTLTRSPTSLFYRQVTLQ